MADTLKYRTVTGSDGAFTVNAGVSISQIIKVSRQGEQKDYVPIAVPGDLLGHQWTFLSRYKRIIFGSNFPFLGTEIIHIIYKESL